MYKQWSRGARFTVTPYVGVWIETKNGCVLIRKKVSHPTWVCGLKQCQWKSFPAVQLSHPTWVCGLKHGCVIYINCMRSHTLRGCVDWNFDYLFYFCFHKVTPCVGIYGLEHCSLVGQVYGRTVSIRPLMYFSPGFWFCYDWKKHVQARMLIFCLFSFVVSPRWQYIGT